MGFMSLNGWESPLGDQEDQNVSAMSEPLIMGSNVGSDSLLNVILSTSAAALASVRVFADRTYIYDYCSAGYTALFGYSAAAMMANQTLWWSRVHPDDIAAYVIPSFDAIFAESPVQFEYRFQHQDGSWRWLMVSMRSQWESASQSWRVIKVHTDISERKRIEEERRQAEAALRDSEEQLQFALKAAQIGSWDWDMLTNQIIWSESMEQLMGLKPGMFDGQFETVKAMIHPEDRPRVLEAITRSVEQGDEYSIEFRFVKVDGSIRWASGKGTVLYDRSGQPVRMTGIDVDITAQKLVELSLQQTLQELTHHIDNSPLATIRWDREFRVEQWSQQAERMFGWTAADVVGKTMYDWRFIVEEDRDQVNQLAAQLLQGINGVSQNRNYHKDGSVLYCEWYNSTLLDAEGHLVSILSLVQDVSERIRGEAERHQAASTLKESEARFMELSEASPANIYILVRRVDGSLYFEHMSRAIETIHEIPAPQILENANLVLDCIHPEDQAGYEAAALHSLETLQPFRHEWRIITPSGTMKWIQGNSRPRVRDNGEIAWYGVVLDISDRKRFEAERQAAEAALAHQSEREHSLRLITQHIRETLELDDILATAVTEIQRILHADRTLIFRLNSDHSGVVIQEIVRPDYPATLAMRWDDECFPAACYASYCQGKTRIVPNVALDDWGKCLVEFMQQMKVQSKVVAPITQTQKNGTVHVWGLLIVHACAEPRIWYPDEADLLQQVADQLAIAIQQSELYSQVQRLNVNLEQQVQDRTADLQQALEFEMLLKRITDQVRDSLDEDQILEAVVRELGQGLQVECCDTGLYNADLTTSTIAHEFTASLTSAKGVTFAIAEATHRDIYPFLFQGQILQFCDRTPCVLRSHYHHLTILACPILNEQRVVGDMWLYRENQFSEAEVRLVQQVVNQCAIALRQSWLYQSAQAQVQELERLNHLKDDFLSTVSHELRTPISSIKMAIQMLEISLKPTGFLSDLSQPSSRYFQILKIECQRELQLINDLLDLAHLDAGTEPLHLSSIDLRILIPHIAEPFLQRTDQHQQHFELIIPEDLPPIVTDLSYLERVVTELLHNACKYTPAGQRICLSIHRNVASVILAVSNSGVEISDTECDRIFDKFYRIPNNDPWKHGGTGLGLALVKKLVEQLGGTIQVESSNGQTTFILELCLF